MKSSGAVLLFGAVAAMAGAGIYFAQGQPPLEAPVPSDLEELVRKLKNGQDADGQIDAALQLAQRPEDIRVFFGPLARLIGSRNSLVRQAAERALLELGAPAVDAVEPLLNSRHDDDFYLGCELVVLLAPETARWKHLIARELQNSSAPRSFAALYAMRGIGASMVEQLPAVIDQLGSPHMNTRIAACRAIIAMGPAAAEAIPELRRLLAEGEPSTRSHAAWALGAVGPVDSGFDVVAELTGLLDAPSHPVRERSALGLAAMGPPGAAAAPKLREKSRDKVASIQPQAALALWRVTGNHREAGQLLIEIVRDPTHELTAMQYMGDIGGATDTCVPFLIQCLASEDGSIRDEAAAALEKIGPTAASALPELRKLLEDPDPLVRWSVRHAIAALEK